MMFIKVYAKNKPIKSIILDWLIKLLYAQRAVSLVDLLRQHMDDVSIEDNDILSYHDVGWNLSDLIRLCKARDESDNLEIPEPKFGY
jgi:hypothetical protein